MMADPEVLKIFDELKKLHEQKDADYAAGEPLSNFKRCEQFGIPAWKGVAVRLSDKYSRFVSLASSDAQHENLNDTLADLAVYAVICLALRKQDVKVVNENKIMEITQMADVSDDQEISTSGDRVKREDGYSGHKIVGSSWDDAKREPVEECARRFKNSEDERRNFTGIND